MKKLTNKEEEVMIKFWDNGPMFIKELKAFFTEQGLHYNTLSTIVRALEEKGYIAHESFGNTYRYYAAITAEEYRKGTLGNVVKNYFDNSYKNVVSLLVKNEDISVEELKSIIKDIEKSE